MNIKKLLNAQKFMGRGIGQISMAYLIFPKFFEIEKFDIVLEIGTWNGIFSMFLNFCCLIQNMKFETIDIDIYGTPETYKHIEMMGGKFHQMDVYSPDAYSYIRDILQSDNRILFLCDGAIKQKCINTFVEYLKPNDVVMGHDYFKTKSHFIKQNKWKSCELTDAYISDACDKYNLETIYEDGFNSIFWTCRIKRK